MVTTASTLCTTCQMVGAIDNGHVAFLPSSCQLTCGCVRMQWPGVQGLKDPPHAQLPLFGGAAFRALHGRVPDSGHLPELPQW